MVCKREKQAVGEEEWPARKFTVGDQRLGRQGLPWLLGPYVAKRKR